MWIVNPCKKPLTEAFIYTPSYGFSMDDTKMCKDCKKRWAGEDDGRCITCHEEMMFMILDLERHEHQQSAWGGNDPHG